MKLDRIDFLKHRYKVVRKKLGKRDHMCCIRNSVCRGRIDKHHVRTRGAGGKDENNIVPLCRLHHQEIHRIGRKTFAIKYDINLEELARKYKF